MVSEYVASGYIYSANCGWINLGDGIPGNHPTVPTLPYYSNTSATDFGVNVQSAGTVLKANLRGYAYGANIGWINFESQGNPQVDLGTGAFSGYAYSANCGWINLGPFSASVVTTSITPETDSDGDGIADGFELYYVGNLTTMNATTDYDKDGILDAAEYLADTDPLNRTLGLKITAFGANGSGTLATITWTSQLTRKYRIEKNDNLTTPWVIGEDDLSPTGAFTSRTLSDTATDKRFFRVKAFRPRAARSPIAPRTETRLTGFLAMPAPSRRAVLTSIPTRAFTSSAKEPSQAALRRATRTMASTLPMAARSRVARHR